MEQFYDVVIVGGGPAGLTAALYLARARYRVLVLEKLYFGGQIAITEEVVNYPGISSISGKDLTETMRAQAESFGAEFRLEEAIDYDFSEKIKVVQSREGQYRCLGVLLATGAHPRPVGFVGEEEFKGRGVAYCATCDGEFFTGKDIFVVGGGYAAAEESVFLTKFARHVTILVRKNDFSCPASVAEKAKNHEKITVLTNTVLEEVSGKDGLTYARYKNTVTGRVTEVRAENGEDFGVFVFAGYTPDTQTLRNLVPCDERGYLLTDEAMKTQIEGVYAAGDVRIKPLRQVVTATGDGALAATELEKYVAKMQEETGMRRKRREEKTEKRENAHSRTAMLHEGAALFDGQMRRQLQSLFDQMPRKMCLRLHLDGRPVSTELERFMLELAEMTDKLQVLWGEKGEDMPFVSVCTENGEKTGLAFHGVPSGHEFSAFMMGILSAAGGGKILDEKTISGIKAIERQIKMQIFVTLSCSMCPELVTSAQRIAAHNPLVTAHVYDLRHFEHLRQKYKVMSVPCLVVDDKKVYFGTKNTLQLLEILAQNP